MKNYFEEIAFPLLTEFEGRHSWDKYGGDTYWGITEKYYPGVVFLIKSAPDEEKRIAIAKDFYKRVFWDALNCDKYQFPLNIIIFDTAVNLGIERVKKFFYEISQISSEERIQSCLLLLYRAMHYVKVCEQDSNKKQYLFGWLRRVKRLFELTKEG